MSVNWLDLLGKTREEKATHETLSELIEKTRKRYFNCLFSDDPKKEYFSAFEDTGFENLRQLSLFLGQSEFFLKTLTYSDIQFSYLSDFIQDLSKNISEENHIERFTNLKALQERVNQIDPIYQYKLKDTRRFFPFAFGSKLI